MQKNYNKKTPYLVIELLESFSKKELDRLGQFCISPYFNTDRFVIKLLDVLVKKVLHKSILGNEVHTRIYNTTFTDAPKVKNTLNQKQKALLNAKMSALTKLAERFLTIEALENSKTNRCELLLGELVKKKQFRLHKKHLKKEQTVLKNEDYKDFEYFSFSHLLEEEKFSYYYHSGKWIKEDNLNEVMRSLDLRYLAKKLTYTITGLSYNRNRADKKYDQSILGLLESGIFNHVSFDTFPFFILQIANIKLMIDKTLHSYKNLLLLLDEHENYIPTDYLKSFYTVAVSYSLNEIKKGKSKYFYHYIELTKKLEQKNLLFTSKAFSIQKLKNIVTIGCRVGEFDWVLSMIEKCTQHIEKSSRTDVINYNKGYVAFQKKEYDSCIDYLLEVNNFNIRYDINRRILLIKSYFELEKHYSDPTAQVFRSIETFIKRNKLINTKDKTYATNFIKLTFNLYRYKHKIGKMKLEKIKEKFENAKLISEKAWLQEKIEELEKRK